ncbi:hypothetical protein JXL21_06195 [Candidatus Bathyarchaeota archaeon]|nr:hypothetical protein [Candidatus Bathyarchaeota archaeon]
MEYSDIPTTRIRGSGRILLQGYGTVKVSGRGDVSPEKVSTSGSCKIPGGLKVGELRTSGSSTVEGDITADYIEISGSSNIEGTASFKSLDKSGSLTIEGDAVGDTLDASGSTTINGDANVETRFESSGSIRVGGSVESGGLVSIRGRMKIRGSVRARHFEAELSRDVSYIEGGVKAESVHVEPRYGHWDREGLLRTGDVEAAGEVYLENVECRSVRGGKVTIGDGCRVTGAVEYRDTVKVSPDAHLAAAPVKIE